MCNLKLVGKHFWDQSYSAIAVALAAFYTFFKELIPDQFQEVLKGAAIILIPVLIIFALFRAYQEAEKEIKQKKSVDRLGEFWIEAVNQLFAKRIENDNGFNEWKTQYNQWVNNVETHLKENFSSVEASLFRHVGSFTASSYIHSYNPDHNNFLLHLVVRMERLRDIMTRHSTLLFLKGVTLE